MKNNTDFNKYTEHYIIKKAVILTDNIFIDFGGLIFQPSSIFQYVLVVNISFCFYTEAEFIQKILNDEEKGLLKIS